MSTLIKVYCTDSEKVDIKKMAKAAGYSKLSHYLRDAALNESSRMVLTELIGYMVQMLDSDFHTEEKGNTKTALFAIAQSLLDNKPIKQARADIAEVFWNDHQSHTGEQRIQSLPIRS